MNCDILNFIDTNNSHDRPKPTMSSFISCGYDLNCCLLTIKNTSWSHTVATDDDRCEQCSLFGVRLIHNIPPLYKKSRRSTPNPQLQKQNTLNTQLLLFLKTSAKIYTAKLFEIFFLTGYKRRNQRLMGSNGPQMG